MIGEEISAVVCTWNAEQSIGPCLKSLVDVKIGEIILVDANSDDNTRQIAGSYTDLIYEDPRKGLAAARNIGIAKASKPYILNFGCDNVLEENTLELMYNELLNNSWTGVSAMTRLASKDNYFSFALDLYKKARYFPGERDVIGTPTLFRRSDLQNNPYDPNMGWSDDGDLCHRLRVSGGRFCIANTFVREIGSETYSSIKTRWLGYGRSDYETYNKYSPHWSYSRKIISFLYPFNNELINPIRRLMGADKLKVLPFLILITMVRYIGWIKYFQKERFTEK